VVGGFVEPLADAPDLPAAESRRYFDLMLDHTRRMQRLLDDLLMLSRLEGSEHTPDETVDVHTLALALKTEAESLSRGRHHVVLRPESGAWLTGNLQEIRSALGNLVSNAVRYTPAGGEITLTWHTTRSGEGVFAVADTGEGIAAEHIPRLTERFYRVDRSRSRETGGTGLGLAIVKHVLTRHEARLDIQSIPGKGSTFSAVFPAARVLPAPAGATVIPFPERGQAAG